MEPTGAWDVVVVGGINTDYLLRGTRLPGPGTSLSGDRFLEAPGGKGANAAVAAARLGARAAIVGCVGDDARGRALIDHLTAEGVHAAHVGIDPYVPTGAAVIHVDDRGQNQTLAALGANHQLSVADVDAAAATIRVSKALVTQFEIPIVSAAAAIRIASDARVPVVLDPAPPFAVPDSLLSLVDVIRANAGEVEVLTGIRVTDRASARAGAQALVARGAHAAIVEAPEGNLLVWPSGEEWIPELHVKRIDVTGAGDAFAAGVAVALAEGRALSEAARLGSGAAALATTALGAQTALPMRRELQTFLEEVATHAHQ